MFRGWNYQAWNLLPQLMVETISWIENTMIFSATKNATSLQSKSPACSKIFWADICPHTKDGRWMGGEQKLNQFPLNWKPLRFLTVDWISFLLSGPRRYLKDTMHHHIVALHDLWHKFCAMIYHCCALSATHISNVGQIWQDMIWAQRQFLTFKRMINAQDWHQFSLAAGVFGP